MKLGLLCFKSSTLYTHPPLSALGLNAVTQKVNHFCKLAVYEHNLLKKSKLAASQLK